MSGVLEGQVAVVTGGGSGIGAAIARAFADAGSQVVVAGRRMAPLQSLAAETGGLAVATDVADEGQIAALFAKCEDAFGRLDILVNNAGVQGPIVAAEDMDAAAWDATMAVNVRGVMLCIKHALPALKKSRGAIVNLSSRVGLLGYATPERSAYEASKCAVVAITESVAAEVGRFGVRVNTLCPSAVMTEPLLANVARKARARGVSTDEVLCTDYIETTALGRVVEPADVANAAVFLAAPAASAITGAHLKVDAAKR
ncbi:MAG: SDR family oxidoreductase [Rhodospirillales bacterium]|nr:SDR family oxidoreductase [Rhodospirillales bacterium]